MMTQIVVVFQYNSTSTPSSTTSSSSIHIDMSVIKLPTEPVILTNKEHSNRVVDLAQYDASGIIIGHGSKADTKYDNQNQKVRLPSHPVSSLCSSSD